MKSFYDFNRNSPQERLERNSLYPELANFHIALREEMNDEEYQEFYQAEKEASRQLASMFHRNANTWISA